MGGGGSNAIEVITAASSISSSSTDQSSYSFTNQSFGAAETNRVVIAFCHGARQGTAQTISSATIGGVSATILKQTPSGGTYTSTAIIGATVPTGTSGTVALTYSGSLFGCGISVMSLRNVQSLSAASSDSFSTTTSGTSINYDLTGSVGGIILAMGGTYSGDYTGTFSWATDLTESITEMIDDTWDDGGTDVGFASAYSIINDSAVRRWVLSLSQSKPRAGVGIVLR